MLQLNDNSLAGGFQSRLNALSLRLEAMGHPAVGVASGRRLKALQEQIFRDRYRRQDSGSGPYGDIRWWDGDGDGRRERWVRVKSGGTVLPPGDSTHEDPPATGADLSWPYNNRYTAAHAALVAICEEYGIRWTGVGFGEDWHFDSIWDPYNAFAASEAKPFEEDDMYTDEDRKRDIEAAKDAREAREALTNGSKYDSSKSPLERIEIAAVDTHDRLFVRDESGNVLWDVFQELIQTTRAIADVTDEELDRAAKVFADEQDRRRKLGVGQS